MTSHITYLIVLLFIFQFKHWLCDYPLQTPYMLQKFKLKGWILPLAAHAGAHAMATMLIVSLFFLITKPLYDYTTFVLYLGFIDFTVHFIVDRIKAHPHIGGKYKIDNPKFWWCLGVDQMCHHLTHYFIIVTVIFNF